MSTAVTLPDLEAVRSAVTSYTKSRTSYLAGVGSIDEGAEQQIKAAYATCAAVKHHGTDLKASEARDVQAALDVLTPAMEQIAQDRSPVGKARPVLEGVTHRPGAKAYGGSPLLLGRTDLQEMQNAAVSKSFLSKGIAVTNAPMSSIAEYATDVFPFLRDKPRLRELIPTQSTERPSVTYYRGLAAASAAAAVAEGADKPESSPTWESVTVAMSKIAHYGLVNDEVIADFDAWMQVIGGEFVAGLIDAENDAIINGTGVSPQMTGLLATTGIQTQAFSGNNLETLAKAATKLRTGAAYTEPDTIIMNPSNWETVELFRVGGSTTTDGPYLMNPLTSPALSLWGVKVVLTNRIAAGTAIVANLKTAAEVYVREDVRLEVHPGGGGLAEWKANKTAIRAEERLALTVPRPKAVVKCTSLT